MMPNKILIDSDIILDVLLAREPFCDDSTKFLSLCENKQISGFVTGLAIANIHYLLRKEYQSKEILREIKKLLNFVDVLIIDKTVILNAIDSDFNDFEDALQNFSAEQNRQIDAIVTRNIKDIKDYKKSKISVLSPSQFLQNYKQ